MFLVTGSGNSYQCNQSMLSHHMQDTTRTGATMVYCCCTDYTSSRKRRPGYLCLSSTWTQAFLAFLYLCRLYIPVSAGSNYMLLVPLEWILLKRQCTTRSISGGGTAIGVQTASLATTAAASVIPTNLALLRREADRHRVVHNCGCTAVCSRFSVT